MVTDQDKINNFKNTIIIMLIVIVLALCLLNYTNDLICKDKLEDSLTLDNETDLTLFDGGYKPLYISNSSDNIMIDETPLENTTLSEQTQTFTNQS